MAQDSESLVGWLVARVGFEMWKLVFAVNLRELLGRELLELLGIVQQFESCFS